MRVGGPADWLFQPKDPRDLAEFLRELDPEISVFPMGVGSNLIVRDGGIRGIVIRLGRGFGSMDFGNGIARIGAAALDSRVAVGAAAAGLDLTFLRTIPGSIGGAIRMNAGCYGSYIADVFREATVAFRSGEIVTLGRDDIKFEYRRCNLPDQSIVVEAVFEPEVNEPFELEKKMAAHIAMRNSSQPSGVGTAGSAFRNPSGFSSTGRADDHHGMKAWTVIDAAGMRGAKRGGAEVSAKHPNFLVNSGCATATDIEKLGEEVRSNVLKNSGTVLEWEIMIVGDKSAGEP